MFTNFVKEMALKRDLFRRLDSNVSKTILKLNKIYYKFR